MPPKQLPTYSPVTLASLVAGARALLGDGVHARAQVEALVRAEYAPRALLLTDSGTSALTLALRAAARSRPDAAPLVALPAYACFDLVTAAVGADCQVVFYDVDPSTLGPAWPSLARALETRPVAVVVAHLYGVPVDVPRLRALADAAGAVVVDDAAQGIGARLAGRPVGTHGSLGVLSFGRGKGRTGGAGGALLANDASGEALLAHVAGEARTAAGGAGVWARLGAQWLLARPSLYPIPASIPALGLGETPYHAPGPVGGMPAAAAAALVANWREATREVNARRAVAAAWGPTCDAAGWQRPESDAPDAVPGCLRFPALVPAPNSGWDVAERLGRGIMGAYPRPLPELEALAGRTRPGGPFPGAVELVRRLVTLPCHRHVESVLALTLP